MAKESLISVVMATYNDKPEYIHKSIDSIINQTYGKFELLIIDDSTDDEARVTIDSFNSVLTASRSR